MRLLKAACSHALHLFFPHHCAGCGNELLQPGDLLCLRCYHELPQTGFAVLASNPVENIFRGRLTLTAAHAEFFFAKGSLLQHLVHQLKYRNNREAGIFLGEMMGRSLFAGKRFVVDCLVPLPLHPGKERKRGYNQATVICQGMANVMPVPVLEGCVTRRRFTGTQTKKHRTERWENVEGSFFIPNPGAIIGKHILLVDDVITTGATIEACGQELLAVDGVRLSVAALAIATK